MYQLKSCDRFILIKGSDIIKEQEVIKICRQAHNLASKENINQLLLDTREVDLENSSFDAFVDCLTKLKVNNIALVLNDLLSEFKFRLWSRKYQPQINIHQFSSRSKAESWLERVGN